MKDPCHLRSIVGHSLCTTQSLMAPTINFRPQHRNTGICPGDNNRGPYTRSPVMASTQRTISQNNLQQMLHHCRPCHWHNQNTVAPTLHCCLSVDVLLSSDNLVTQLHRPRWYRLICSIAGASTHYRKSHLLYTCHLHHPRHVLHRLPLIK